jgi:hypothetical protein
MNKLPELAVGVGVGFIDPLYCVIFLGGVLAGALITHLLWVCRNK